MSETELSPALISSVQARIGELEVELARLKSQLEGAQPAMAHPHAEPRPVEVSPPASQRVSRGHDVIALHEAAYEQFCNDVNRGELAFDVCASRYVERVQRDCSERQVANAWDRIAYARRNGGTLSWCEPYGP